MNAKSLHLLPQSRTDRWRLNACPIWLATLSLVLIQCAALAAVNAQPPSTWVGKPMLVTQTGTVKLRVGNKDVGAVKDIVVSATQEKGDWVYVTTREGMKGWLMKSQALPMDQAEAVLSSRIRQEPRNDYNYFLRGIVHGYYNRQDQKLADLNQAIRLNSSDAAYYNGRGNVYSAKNQYEQALVDFNRAIRLDPQAIYYINAAYARWDLGQYEKALDNFTKAIRLDPTMPYVYRERAAVYLDLERPSEALTDFSTARRMDPEYLSDTYYYEWGSEECEEEAAWMLEEASVDEIASFVPVDAFDYAYRADAWRAKGLLDRAIADQTSAISKAPADERDYLYRERASMNLMTGRLAEARSDCDMAIRLAPDSADAYNERGIVRLRQHQEAGAMGDFNRALELSDRYLPALLNRGGLHFRQGDLAAATADYLQARLRWVNNSLLRPQNFWAADGWASIHPHTQYADSTLETRRDAYHLTFQGEMEIRQAKMQKDSAKRAAGIERGLRQLADAMQENPQFALPLYCRGMHFQGEKSWEAAIADLSQAAAIDDRFGEAWFQLGYSRMQVPSRWDEAMQDFQRAIELNTELAAAHLNRGWILTEQGRYPEAIAEFDQSLAVAPKYALAFNDRGWVYHKMKDYDRAIEQYTQAIQNNPNYAQAYANRGDAQRAKGQYAGALEDYLAAIKVSPDFHKAHVSLTWLYATCPEARYRDGTKAVEFGKKACELTGWKDANDLCNLACAYAEAGDFDEAVKWQAQANQSFTPEQKEEWGFLLDQFKA